MHCSPERIGNNWPIVNNYFVHIGQRVLKSFLRLFFFAEKHDKRGRKCHSRRPLRPWFMIQSVGGEHQRVEVEERVAKRIQFKEELRGTNYPLKIWSVHARTKQQNLPWWYTQLICGAPMVTAVSSKTYLSLSGHWKASCLVTIATALVKRASETNTVVCNREVRVNRQNFNMSVVPRHKYNALHTYTVYKYISIWTDRQLRLCTGEVCLGCR